MVVSSSALPRQVGGRVCAVRSYEVGRGLRVSQKMSLRLLVWLLWVKGLQSRGSWVNAGPARPDVASI